MNDENLEDTPWDEWCETYQKETLVQLTDNFTSYPLWWNDAICFTKNPLMCIPSSFIDDEDDMSGLLSYDYIEIMKKI